MSKEMLMSAEEVKAQMDGGGDLLIIDVRDAEDYAKEHISGAVSVPDFFYHLTTTSDEELETTYKKFAELLSAAGLKNGNSR